MQKRDVTSIRTSSVLTYLMQSSNDKNIPCKLDDVVDEYMHDPTHTSFVSDACSIVDNGAMGGELSVRGDPSQHSSFNSLDNDTK
eukprot:c3263_g1_i1 orf=615-869(+)